MKQRYEIILAGSGGQGLVLSARLLGAAAILEGKNVVQTQSVLGDAQRGGLSVAELIIDRDEVIFQQVEQPDIIVALGDMAIKKYGDMNAEIVTLYEGGLANLPERDKLQGLPFAAEAAKHDYAVNMLALGAMLATATPVSMESLTTAVRQSFSGKAAEKNVEALQHGLKLAAETLGKKVQSV